MADASDGDGDYYDPGFVSLSKPLRHPEAGDPASDESDGDGAELGTITESPAMPARRVAPSLISDAANATRGLIRKSLNAGTDRRSSGGRSSLISSDDQRGSGGRSSLVGSDRGTSHPGR